MKSVLRSVFDPVPRPLSPGAQLLLVGVLIVGIAISVVEYVQSSQPASVAAEGARQPAKAQAVSGSSRQPEALVRVRGTPGTTVEGTKAGVPAQPSASSASPMSLQPGEGG